MSLAALTDALRIAIARTPGLAAVQLATGAVAPDSASMPLAVLSLDRTHTARASIDSLTRVRYAVTLHRRDANRQANARALASLADAVTAALLADPTQGRLAVPGPAGHATEIVHWLAPRQPDPPLACLTLRVACWTLPPDALIAPAPADCARVNNQSLFASGPHALTTGSWQRRRIDRQFAGLNGTVAIDLGAVTRPIALAGRLVAASATVLLAQIAAIDAINTASTCTITAPDGRSFVGVRVEHIRWGRVLCTASHATVAYQITFAQLGAANA